MAFAYSRLAEITTLGTAASAIVTHVSGKTYARLIMLHNTGTSAETVKLYTVPNSGTGVGTAADANKFYEESVESKGTRIIELAAPGIVLLDANDTIQGLASTVSKVTIQVTGGTE